MVLPGSIPQIRRQQPQAHLLIIGRDPVASIQALAQDSNVTVTVLYRMYALIYSRPLLRFAPWWLVPEYSLRFWKQWR